MNKQTVSTGAAAKALGIGQTTLTRWAEAGEVTPALTTVGGHRKWDLDDLRRQVAERAAARKKAS